MTQLGLNLCSPGSLPKCSTAHLLKEVAHHIRNAFESKEESSLCCWL